MLLEFDSLELLDFPKLMEVCYESNTENEAAFFRMRPTRRRADVWSSRSFMTI